MYIYIYIYNCLSQEAISPAAAVIWLRREKGGGQEEDTDTVMWIFRGPLLGAPSL